MRRRLKCCSTRKPTGVSREKRTKTSLRDELRYVVHGAGKAAWRDQEELLRHDGIGRESLVFEQFARSDRDVGASAAQQRDMLVCKTGQEAELGNVEALARQHRKRRRQRGRDRRQKCDPEQRKRRGIDAPRVRSQGFDLRQDGKRAAMQRRARLRELDRPLIAVDQRQAQSGLEVLQVLRGGGLGHAQHLRRLGYLACFDDGSEDLERA